MIFGSPIADDMIANTGVAILGVSAALNAQCCDHYRQGH
jgi:hypothetical protein